MGDNPKDVPLGGKPVLPVPQGSAAQKASRAFLRYLDELREEQQPPLEPAQMREPASVAESGAGELPDPGSFPASRRYDAALAKVESALRRAAEEVVSVEPLEKSSRQEEASTLSDVETERAGEGIGSSRSPCKDDLNETGACSSRGDAVLPEEPSAPSSGAVRAAATLPDPHEEVTRRTVVPRPPPGAPAVRPSVRERAAAEAVPQELLEQTAQSALLASSPDGTTSFDIAFSDELFAELACRISVLDGRVTATFLVRDQNTRRLLEAEAGRLRANLERRGLRVEAVRVEVDEARSTKLR